MGNPYVAPIAAWTASSGPAMGPVKHPRLSARSDLWRTLQATTGCLVGDEALEPLYFGGLRPAEVHHPLFSEPRPLPVRLLWENEAAPNPLRSEDPERYEKATRPGGDGLDRAA